MKRRIIRNMLLLNIICVVLSTAVLMFVLSNMANRREESDLGNRAVAYAKALDYFEQDYEFIAKPELTIGRIRLTVISPDGIVLYDTADINTETLDNHADRPEVREALNSVTGHGKSRRYSATLGQSTFYHAIRLNSGDVLRLSKTTDTMLFTIADVLPIMMFAVAIGFIVSLLLSIRLTQRIIKPLNEINFDYDESFDSDIEVFDELSPFIRKIKAQEEKIKEQYIDLRDKSDTIDAIIFNMREGILLLDEKQNIMLANASAARFIENERFNFGHTGENITRFVRDSSFLDCIKKAFSGERCTLSRTLDGRAVEVFFSPVETGGETDGLLILFLDVTEKVNAEKLRREFSANVSHELKTPLTAILGMSEMLVEGMVKREDADNFTKAIREEATRLLRLIEDIIRLSQLDESEKIELEEFDAGVVAADIIERLSGFAAEKDVKLTLRGGGVIKAGKSLIDEMLYNLIDNGIKYNKVGGEVITEIKVNKNGAEFIVSDTGIGIEPAHTARIFERFYRVDKSRSKKTGGTGLGLSIVKHIAEYHGGSVNIETKAGAGTKIIVKI